MANAVYNNIYVKKVCLEIQCLQIFPLQGAMVGGNSKTLLYLFKKPVSGNTIFMDFYPSNCGVADCSFCLRMELYGNQLGLYRLYILKTKMNTVYHL